MLSKQMADIFKENGNLLHYKYKLLYNLVIYDVNELFILLTYIIYQILLLSLCIITFAFGDDDLKNH